MFGEYYDNGHPERVARLVLFYLLADNSCCFTCWPMIPAPLAALVNLLPRDFKAVMPMSSKSKIVLWRKKVEEFIPIKNISVQFFNKKISAIPLVSVIYY